MSRQLISQITTPTYADVSW